MKSGSVELLTREGEIEIAKRIEEGLRDMISAISSCPTTILEIIDQAEKIRADEVKIDEVVDGLADDEEGSENAALNASASDSDEDSDEEDSDEEDSDDEEDDEESGSAGGAAAGFSAEQLEKLEDEALGKFAVIGAHFKEMQQGPFEKDGYNSPAYLQAHESISAELFDHALYRTFH